MLKYILLASAMTISVPALAQDKPVSTDPATTTEQPMAQTAPVQTPSAATTSTEAAPVADPATPAPAQDSAMAEATPAPADPAAAATPAPAETAATPPSKAEQVATVVNSEFPTYDKDSNGDLNETEFASWMVALKTASDPTTKAESAETKTWIGQAFASADADKSKSVSKTELTGFLSQG